MTRSKAWLLAIPLVAMTPGLLHGQTITGPDAPVPPYRLARVAVDGADSVAFDSTPLNGSEDYDGEAVGSTYFLTGAPGRHRVMAFALKDGRPVILKTTVTFAGESLDPLPVPDPTPTPGPKPPPARTELQKIAIEYAYAVPMAAKAAAPRVSSGEMTEVGQVVASIAASRDATRRKLADAIAAALEGAYDPATGRITDRSRVAAVMSDLGGLVP